MQGGGTDDLERLETYGALVCASVWGRWIGKEAEILSSLSLFLVYS